MKIAISIQVLLQQVHADTICALKYVSCDAGKLNVAIPAALTTAQHGRVSQLHGPLHAECCIVNVNVPQQKHDAVITAISSRDRGIKMATELVVVVLVAIA